jgi:alpha-methylacyl-CoA racemase
MNDEQASPLQHLRVLDLTQRHSGAYLTRLLAQYGAEVIKVETLPEGDPVRQNPAADWLNQGKKSVAIDLKNTEGQNLIRSIAAEVDVFIENSREGVMDGLGLGYERLSGENPELLYVSLRAFGGKNASKAGLDLNAVAASGVGEWFLERGPHYSANWADLMAGALVPALKILMHLSNPDRRGMKLLSSMDESVRSLFLLRAFESLQDPKPLLPGTLPHSRFYRCAEGNWISVNASSQKHWQRFCEAIGQPGWRHRKDDMHLTSELERFFEQNPSNYWEALMANHDACVFRVVPLSESLLEPSAKASFLNDPFGWAGFAASVDLGSAPSLGRDTSAVLAAFGATERTLRDLYDRKILFQAEV